MLHSTVRIVVTKVQVTFLSSNNEVGHAIECGYPDITTIPPQVLCDIGDNEGDDSSSMLIKKKVIV